jgi:hypothetical protein
MEAQVPMTREDPKAMWEALMFLPANKRLLTLTEYRERYGIW